MTLLAGAVSIDITPPIGIHLHNWAYSPHPIATGIHQPLKAQILAVENEETGFIAALIAVISSYQLNMMQAGMDIAMSFFVLLSVYF